ncbi:hypothetical protein D9611_014489 [Ephemerocybe angulata]|uniref:MYND-type domain-containing protein n=1 Tax=Ephemerocybe angulata TaxID=980116 RepID=A0A8H5FFE8_9AGAR|nr:hypothetical protein D9611_014489 [Tulosesus angulatus]
MSHPLIWPSKSFFYAIGNTSAVSVTMDLSPDEPARILLLGCGDPRNVLYTIYTDGTGATRPLDFTCCDIEPAVLARNVLLFTLITDGRHSEDSIWNIFFHFRLDAKAHTLLIEQSKKLIDLSENPKTWRESAYGSSLKMATDYTLSEVRRHWELYIGMQDLPAARRKALDAMFTAQGKENAQQGRCSTVTRSLGPLIGHPSTSAIYDSLKTYWKTGTTFIDEKSISQASILNPTFVYSIAGEGCSVHYGTDPLIPFHLAPVFANSKPPSFSDIVKAVKAQFSDWCSAYRTALSSPTPPIVRSFLGEATATCHALGTFASSGVLSAGIPVAQWKTQLIQLNRWEYVDGPQPAPCSFNAIHTSNLEDHIGLLNVLIPAIPLLSPGPSSVLYTESLLSLGTDPTKEFVEHLKADITIIGLLFGISPVDYLCGFTTRSNMHELMHLGTESKNKTKSKAEQIGNIGQYQQLVTWKSPVSGDPVAALLQVPPPLYDAYQMATFFYDLYQSLFAKESAMNFWQQHSNPKDYLKAVGASNITAHYTREAFVLFVKLIKDRLQPSDIEWSSTIQRFDGRLLDTWSGQNMETMHYQDLCGQLHRYGLYKAQSFTPPARKIGPFAVWPTVPDLIRIVLVVPRSALHVLESSSPEEVGTPPLHCDIHGQNCSNLFTSVHAAFGRAIPMGTKQNPQVKFEEDVKGWKGKSSLVLSFTAPSYLITELEHPASLEVAFGVKNTPAACATLIQKLGIRLHVYSAKLMDSSQVFILPEPPLPARRLRTGRASTSPTAALSTALAQIGEAERSVLEFDDDCEGALSLAIRVNVTDEASLKLFSSDGSKVVPEIEQMSACVVRIKLGERAQDIAFPFPVIGSQNRLRLARKSRYIEVIVPTSRSFVADGMKYNPYPVMKKDNTLVAWSLHHVNLSRMPVVNLNAKGLARWLDSHLGSMMSARERKLRRKHKHDALMFIKDTIHSIMVKASGVQPVSGATGSGRSSLFSLVDEKTNNSDTIIFISDLRFDLASHTVVCDGFVVPFLEAVEKPFAKLIHQGGLCSVPVFEGEMQGWKQLLPAFVERCRSSWTHGPNCEYTAHGKIPLTEDMEANPLCSCGQGKDVDGMLKMPLWKPFAPYATRIAMSPLFAVSYLERVQPKLKKCSMCRKKGEGYKSCSGCKKVRYCSSGCQKKDWKSHKPKCKA